MGRKIKVVNLVLDSYGSFLGMEKACIILRDSKGKTEKYPLVQTEIGEVVLQSGNMVSTGVLSSLGSWSIDVLVTTRAGRPIAVLKNLNDDAHVKTVLYKNATRKVLLALCPSFSYIWLINNKKGESVAFFP